MTSVSGISPKKTRIVGILGGMGPAATFDFYKKVVVNTPADKEQDHLRVIIWSDPTIPSRQDALLRGGDDPTPWLKVGVERLVRSGAEILVVPCNTAHAFLDAVIPADCEFISILDVTLDAIERRKASRLVGVLATDGALKCGLYQAALANAGYEAVLPNRTEQEELMTIVDRVKSGRADDAGAARLAEIFEALHGRGAAVSIAGCTELSLLLDKASLLVQVDIVDPALELALQTVRRAWFPRSPVTE